MVLPRNIRSRNEKYQKNITKRGNVPVGKAADHQEENQPVNKTFFELSAKDNNGNMFSFESLKSKKAIIVFNSASE